MVIRHVFDSIFGNSNNSSNNAKERLVTEPYARLDEIKRGLGKRVETYVETGAGEGVLADIEALRTPQMETNLRVATSNASILASDCGGDPYRLARISEVRRIASGVPDKLPALFQLLRQINHYKESKTPTLSKDAADAVVILGGSEVDFIELNIPKRRYDNPLRLDDMRTYLDTLEPSLVAQALDRCNAKEKSITLERWKNHAVVKNPAFLDYLFSQLAETSSKVRDAVRSIIAHHDPAKVEELAIKGLGSGKASEREACVQVLGGIGTSTAVDALKARRETEKAQAVQAAIDHFIATETNDVEVRVSEEGFQDANGQFVDFPKRDALVDDGSQPLGKDVLEKLQAIEDDVYAEEMERYESRLAYYRTKGGHAPEKPKRRVFAEAAFKMLNSPLAADANVQGSLYVTWRHQDKMDALLASVLDKLPLARVVELACGNFRSLSNIILQRSDAFSLFLKEAIEDGNVGVDQIIEIAQKCKTPVDYTHNRQESAEPHAARLIELLLSSHSYSNYKAPKGFWEISARNLPLLIEALPPRETDVRRIRNALKLVADFPSIPAALVQPLIFAAIDDRNKIGEVAQKLLRDVSGIDGQIIELLSDKRQAVRASAARLLAAREVKDALPAITKRLKTEKSDIARAELISAVSELGGDTEPFLGKSALLKEAQALVSKLPNAKIDWLELNTAPPLVWEDGSKADPVLQDAWLRLALKLKTPKGSPLFGLYLGKMTPESARAFGDWVLESWLSYDTFQPNADGLRAEAMKRAQANGGPSWMHSIGWTTEQVADAIFASLSSGYANSAADSKGILALSHTASPEMAGPKIATYLKQHGRRVSQAKSLVETLFGMGSKDAVQVLVATATRFKQKTVRELAETLVGELAEARGWTEDELADRSVPTGGFEMDGILPLPIGEESKAYLARLQDDLTITLENPDGKTVKSLPAGKDENTKDSKALLSAARKSLKTVSTQQESRLYEAMLTPRVWPFSDWQADILNHPIMQRLATRLIWRGLDESGDPLCTLRPTPEGDFWDANGDDVELSKVQQIDLAHTANIDAEDRETWLQHMKDFEVKPLFPQVSRPVRALTSDQESTTQLLDRQGWLMTTFKLRSAAKKAGYDRGPIEDGGGFYVYRKEFRGAGLWADLHFTGSYVGEEDIPAAITHMQFTKIGAHRPVPLGKVPPLLLSEIWNDLHEIAKSGAYDEDWKSKGLY